MATCIPGQLVDRTSADAEIPHLIPELDGNGSWFARLAATRRDGGNRAGFTLIELLVVISIIATLASLLMPAISLVKRSAGSAKCRSNLHQMGLATTLYAENWDGYVPSQKRGNPSLGRATVQWFSLIAPFLDFEDDQNGASKISDLAARKATVLRGCPEFKNGTDANMLIGVFGYGMNGNLDNSVARSDFYNSSNPDAPPVGARDFMLSTITSQSTRALYADSDSWALSAFNNDYRRHVSHADYLFCDMHAAGVQPSRALLCVTNPAIADP